MLQSKFIVVEYTNDHRLTPGDSVVGRWIYPCRNLSSLRVAHLSHSHKKQYDDSNIDLLLLVGRSISGWRLVVYNYARIADPSGLLLMKELV